MKLLLCLFAAGCLAAQSLPPKDVPGALNPDVTQANIKTTVCVANWTKTVRPPVSYTNKLKEQKMAEFGLKGSPSAYELDHRVDLAAAGNPRDPKNLWPQPWPEARLKDRLETFTHREMCAGRMTLDQVQKIFLGNFWLEYDRLAPAHGWPPRDGSLSKN